MERRMSKYDRRVSPERTRLWTEKSPKYQSDRRNFSDRNQFELQPPPPPPATAAQSPRKAAVLYYLSRNRQLEHPHFIQVPLSSPRGLYLRDVIERLNVLRGRGMASMYSWSCKRNYKNGFVWHDLCEDDLILPAHGNEYVLKGSELFEEPTSSGHLSTVGVVSFQTAKALPGSPFSRTRDIFSSSSSINGRTTKHSQDDELSPPAQCNGSSSVSRESSVGKNSSSNGSLSLAQYKIYKRACLADASTQTNESTCRHSGGRRTCNRGVSTDDGSLDPKCSEIQENQVPWLKETSEICRDSVPPPPSSSNASSSGGRTDSLESLIKADASKLNSFRLLEEEEFRASSSTKLKAPNMLLQLISCGSISVKDHSSGLIPTYKPSFSHPKFPSPLFSTSLMSGEVYCLSENPGLRGLKLEDKEYFSGSLIETGILKEGLPALKRSSSCNADRTTKHLDVVQDKEERSATYSKCVVRSLKASLRKKPRSESTRSPLSEGRKISSDRVDSSRNMASGMTSGGSKRLGEPSSAKKQPIKSDSCRSEKENVIEIEKS